MIRWTYYGIQRDTDMIRYNDKQDTKVGMAQRPEIHRDIAETRIENGV